MVHTPSINVTTTLCLSQIPQAGLGRRGGEAPSRIDPRDLQNVRRGDSQRAHTPRPRALALERATDAVPKPSHERDQGQKLKSTSSGLSYAKQDVLGTAPLGTGLLLSRQAATSRMK